MFELVLLAPFDAMKRSGTLSPHSFPALVRPRSTQFTHPYHSTRACACVCDGADQLTKEESAVKRSLMNLSLMIGA
jgi:hypothetical protein